LRLPIEREVVVVYEKTICGSADKFACLKAAHVVSTWATDNRLVYTQSVR
jgi:hypothetical protein